MRSKLLVQIEFRAKITYKKDAKFNPPLQKRKKLMKPPPLHTDFHKHYKPPFH